MKIKRNIPKLLSILLSFTISYTNIFPTYAAEIFISETSLEEMNTVETGENVITNDDNLEVQSNDLEVQAIGDSRYEMIEINYNQSSSYYVTIPKTITLGADKRSSYSIKVEGDIVANKQICVFPIDGIEETEVFDFYMKDQTAGSTKEDVIAEVSQSKFYWNHEEAAAGYEENDNYIIADGLSAGKWRGSFQMGISMRTDPSHIHNYVGETTKEPTCTESGEKTYTCDCGDSYTEEIPATGHHYENGECTDCGEKDPDHVHSYTEAVTKEPTCAEAGEKTYTCDCGDSYTEEIPATGHHYENGECTDCGEKEPAHVHSYTETVTKEPTCTETGEKTLTCDCGDVKKDVIPKKEHSYTSAVITNKYPWLSHVSDEIWNPQNINNSYITFSGTGTTTDSTLGITSRILKLKVNNKSSSIASVSGSSIYTVQIDTPGWYHVSLSNTTLSYGTGSGTFPSTLNYLYFYANVDDGLYRGYTAYRDKNTNVISESTKFPDRIFLKRGEHTIKATACINTLKSGSSYELKAVNLNIIGNSHNGEICEYCGTFK